MLSFVSTLLCVSRPKDCGIHEEGEMYYVDRGDGNLSKSKHSTLGYLIDKFEADDSKFVFYFWSFTGRVC